MAQFTLQIPHKKVISITGTEDNNAIEEIKRSPQLQIVDGKLYRVEADGFAWGIDEASVKIWKQQGGNRYVVSGKEQNEMTADVIFIIREAENKDNKYEIVVETKLCQEQKFTVQCSMSVITGWWSDGDNFMLSYMQRNRQIDLTCVSVFCRDSRSK